jgi:solute carrier family 13 (sodium-dependent dicarboxylate transporter), member 2/3/5
MTKKLGLTGGLLAFLIMLALPAPKGMALDAWHMAALIVLMASWWMTEALPLTVTALLPFLVIPLMGMMSPKEIAAAYYSPILFLVLGGAFLALAIERTGLHRRLALAVVTRGGRTPGGLILAFMTATAIVSLIVSNTATTLIMMPIAVAVIAAAGIEQKETSGFAGALVMGVAFAATIGGLGTLVGSPTNAIAAGLIERILGYHISFLTWASFGMPLVIIGIPLCWFILMRLQGVKAEGFDGLGLHRAIGKSEAWSTAEKRLVPLLATVVGMWVFLPLFPSLIAGGRLEDGSIAIAGALLLFVIPDGTGRPLLNWDEANRAPWGVIMMFGGGLALAEGVTASGLDSWLGIALQPLGGVPPIIIACALVGLVILVTEFASNVASASGMMPVVAGLISATGADPLTLALPAAFAASWGFMLPSGTGPNAIAWATGHIALPRMLKAGLLLDLCGVVLIVLTVFVLAPIAG